MPQIHVSDLDSLSDDKIYIKITGLKPGKIYTIHGSATTDMKDEFESLARYKADETGCIDLQHGHSLGGTYYGNEPMGIFSSMEPSLKSKEHLPRFVKLKMSTPLRVKISILDADVSDLTNLTKLKQNQASYNNLELTSVVVNRWFKAKTTKRIRLTVKEHGISGALFIPGGAGPFPAVVVLFGAHPGTFEFKSSLLASHGFVTLALEFLEGKDLPPMFPTIKEHKHLELEYFIKAVDYLCNLPMVDSRKGVGVISLSFGTCVALKMAEFCERVTCVIWINGYIQQTFCDLHYSGLLFQPTDVNLELALATNFREPVSNTLQTNGDISVTKDGQVLNFHKQTDVAYMFIAGADDKGNRTEQNVNHAERLLKSAKHPNYKILRYPGAGHLIEPPYGVCNSVTGSVVLGEVRRVLWGGITLPHCKSQEDSWPKQIDFLKNNLTFQTSKL